MSIKRAILDGWPLAYIPNSAAAIHLRTLLAYLPDGIEPILALPAEAKLEAELDATEQITLASKDLGAWQQKTLQKAAKQREAQLIHSTMLGASLFGRIPTLISPSGPLQADQYASRLSAAQSEGGLQRAHILWPADIPQIPPYPHLHKLAPIAHPDFFSEAEPELPSFIPESYLLAQGPFSEPDLRGMLEAWTWAAASIGEMYPLLLSGVAPENAEAIENLLPQYHLEEYVQVLPELAWSELVSVYKGCSALVVMRDGHYWGQSARLALAVGKTIVGPKNPGLESLVGPAAYLVEQGDLRSLGSTMIGSIVDERIWEKLEVAAKTRSKSWDGVQFKVKLSAIYEKFA